MSREDIVSYLTNELGLEQEDALDETPLFSTGTLDSFSLVSLIGFLENKGGVKIKATDVSLDNFDTIARIVAYVGQRRSADD